jgi:hypothetical protein
MRKYSKKGKVFCLLLFSLFLLEYLEPSAVGVRAYVDFPLTQEIPDGENSPITHALGLNGSSELNTELPVNAVISHPIIPFQKSVFFKIYRPPLSILQPL